MGRKIYALGVGALSISSAEGVADALGVAELEDASLVETVTELVASAARVVDADGEIVMLKFGPSGRSAYR